MLANRMMMSARAIIETNYANPLGTGNRTALITVTAFAVGWSWTGGANSQLVDGTTTGTNGRWTGGGAAINGDDGIRFDLGSAQVIDETKIYFDASGNWGTWKWQGSNNATDWSDIGSNVNLTSVSTTPTTDTAMAGNQTPFRYYQMIGVSGTTIGSVIFNEFQFKVSDL